MTRDRKIVENQGVPEYATYADLPDPVNFKGLAFVQDTSSLVKSNGVTYSVVHHNPLTWATKPTATAFGVGQAWYNECCTQIY